MVDITTKRCFTCIRIWVSKISAKCSFKAIIVKHELNVINFQARHCLVVEKVKKIYSNWPREIWREPEKRVRLAEHLFGEEPFK